MSSASTFAPRLRSPGGPECLCAGDSGCSGTRAAIARASDSAAVPVVGRRCASGHGPVSAANLLDHLGRCDRRAVQRRVRVVPQPVDVLVLVATFREVEHGAADAVVPAGRRDIAADFYRVTQDGQAPVRAPDLVRLRPRPNRNRRRSAGRV
jgi:hypothetical protein